MALRLTEEQLEIRALAREFAAGEIRPFAAAWDAERALDDGIFNKLGELGFLGMRIPEAYGGLALDLTTYCQVLEELANLGWNQRRIRARGSVWRLGEHHWQDQLVVRQWQRSVQLSIGR